MWFIQINNPLLSSKQGINLISRAKKSNQFFFKPFVFSEKAIKQSQDFVRRNYVNRLFCKLFAVLTSQGDMMKVPAETGWMM